MPIPDPVPDPAPTVLRVADLRLRGAAGRLPTRLTWPHPTPGPPPALLVLLPDGPAGGGLGPALCAAAAVVVLTVAAPADAPEALADAVTATLWAADHAAELGADPDRLMVGGEGRGAALAAAVAVHARDDGWPALAHQVLVDPAGALPRAADLAGVAPATVLAAGGPAGAAGRRYADRLARAGVAVTRLADDGAGPARAPLLAGPLRAAAHPGRPGRPAGRGADDLEAGA